MKERGQTPLQVYVKSSGKNHVGDLDQQGDDRPTFKDIRTVDPTLCSRQQDQTQTTAGLDARVGGARWPQSPLEFLKSMLTAGRIRFRVWGAPSWAVHGTQIIPTVEEQTRSSKSGKSWCHQPVDWHFFLNFVNISPRLCRHSLKPVNSRGSRFIQAQCTVIFQVQDCKMLSLSHYSHPPFGALGFNDSHCFSLFKSAGKFFMSIGNSAIYVTFFGLWLVSVIHDLRVYTESAHMWKRLSHNPNHVLRWHH